MELSKKLFTTFLFLFSIQTFALDCSLAEKFNDPKLAGNSKFWDELGKLKDQSDDAVADLIKKHDPQFHYGSAAKTSTSFAIPTSFNVSKKVEKALKLLSPAQKRNFEEFVQTVSGKGGAKALYDNPGKWHYEKLYQYGGASSVRLDQGMRVLFKADADGVVDIIDMGKHIGH